MRISNLIIKGLDKNASDKQLSSVIKEVFLKASKNIFWLKKGDKVLLKPALNSPDPYPATTHPLAIKVISEIIEDRGGEVIVGDQSGVEYVFHSPKGVLHGSSAKNFIKSGMGSSKMNFVGFETSDWDKDFKLFKSNKTTSWKSGFFTTRWIDKIDHIINLPRLSTHAQAGVSLGFKNWVGLLREDSRMKFHYNGPFSWLMRDRAHKLDVKDNLKNRFIERIVEIGLAVKSKLRLTLFVGTKAQATLGPDKKIMSISSKIVTPDQGLVFASDNPVASEVLALAFLTYLYQKLPITNKILQKILIFFNSQIKELGVESVWENKLIKHALKINLGDKLFQIVYFDVPKNIQNELNYQLNV
ncbi:hypothetical protein COS31_00510 [Candidatus Roizmanbacteria bacterium CG02_land_8_20_14_3_00_36_15]|uniref:DUF362 domain-containing protein n=2 Tax=Candidatus Roizmaniibacteriota TaxID=1752723 RepID=A0A2M8KJR0_9BACT|nr:MAG: hypothetical protein COS51_01050 [Candidatus Roizmanbacteria bacterium CG03_land_8_20_14_0_80_36_21]PIV38228.1 MAG: hypothetical protein COS31_00510 [Candidatus Roizmanbacteria bacterium CG02_land_8_20_14_3_00_36_15]PIY70455.1 MAG: hypothetical protein COY89_01015 [Candidatus Roizmanbacteria bacterium CG_4_10_14_0_8_um_filter_36_36]PJA53704.1 MAG: hypothetical protein CO166_00985 [Candidatus Roizmanbacteria bacterium CG_4_9_14_3_um_filter_36_11]PJC81417.1 MAG: hypothetical protein CO007